MDISAYIRIYEYIYIHVYITYVIQLRYLILTYSLYQVRRDGSKNHPLHIPISLLDGMHRYINTRADIDNKADEMYSL